MGKIVITIKVKCILVDVYYQLIINSIHTQQRFTDSKQFDFVALSMYRQ